MSDPIRKGKLDSIGQAERRQKILDFIRQNGVVKSSQIQTALQISRSSLSDDMRKLLSENLVASEKRGIYQINSQAESLLAIQEIQSSTLRQWLILAILSEKERSISELMEVLSDYGFSCSMTTLRSDLKQLRSEQLLFTSESDYQDYGLSYDEEPSSARKKLYSSHAIVLLDKNTIRNYFNSFSNPSERKLSANARVHISAKEDLNRKIKFYWNRSTLQEITSSASGKFNTLDVDQLQQMNFLLKYDYEHYRIRIVYRTYHQETVSCDFYTGMIVYSVETNRIYMIGLNEDDLYTIIPIDSIDIEKTQQENAVVSADNKKKQIVNRYYHSPEFSAVFRQMLNISTEAPQKVEVHFSNLSYVREKVQRLCEIRPATSSLTLSEDRSELIYRDTIRGLEDLARYLRGFGQFARVVAPEELKARMKLTAEKLLALYDVKEGDLYV